MVNQGRTGKYAWGVRMGSAVDEKQVYVAVSNADFIPYKLTKGPDAGRTVKGGFWASLDAATGALIWQNAGSRRPAIDPLPGTIAINTGAVTVANGVVFAGTMDAAGTMYAFNAKTGLMLWTFESGGSVNSGPAVVGGTVYWGSGYANINGTPNNKLYAVTPGRDKKQDGTDDISALSTYDASHTFLVYPNPSKNEVQIVSGDKKNISRVQLYDLAGRLIKDNRIAESTNYNLDLRSVPSGSYIIHITTSAHTVVQKVVVTP
jgi:outer membrane protein assembly factor BamB